MADSDEAVKLIGRMIALIMNLEFSFGTRYGQSCPVCNELRDSGVDYECGPDRGHKKGCELRALLDDVGLDEHITGGD
jgi:hypothetical protein